MAHTTEDEEMADFIPFEPEASVRAHWDQQTNRAQGISAKSQFHEMHPDITLYTDKCVCGRYFNSKKAQRAHQNATGHGACVCGEAFTTYQDLNRHRYEAVHFLRCICSRLWGSTQHLLSHQRLEHHSGYWDTKKGNLKTTALESNTLDEVLCVCGGQMKDDGSNAPLQCICGRVFVDGYTPARAEWPPDTTIFPCSNCSRPFDTWEEMWSHQLFIHHPCISCYTIFICESRLIEHQRATGHCHCGACNEQFMTPDRLRQHLLDTHGVSRSEIFQDAATEERPLSYHVRTPPASHGNDATRPGASIPVYKGGFKSGANFMHINLRCRVCAQEFTSPKTLHDHRTRGWHDPFTSISCPFNTSADGASLCSDDRKYPSVSGLLHHLETGQCGSGIALADLNTALRGGTLEQYILPSYQQCTPVSTTADLSPRRITELCNRAEASALLTANGGIKLACPFCQAAAADAAASISDADQQQYIRKPRPKTFPTKAQLKAHLELFNHTPRFLTYPAFVALPPTKSTRKADFGSWSGLAHSLETLLCAGEVGGVQEALDCVEQRLKMLAVDQGEDADRMVD
ncbi:hypothetical protein IWX49DRAFT_36897 [Phyllosticta citricarpa]|uniref:C2H2-type domain-containing protein n=1 Tax=Phyllosticta citricarpa TaxID=55181 RepID=A0ABR1MJI6_9PEZI